MLELCFIKKEMIISEIELRFNFEQVLILKWKRNFELYQDLTTNPEVICNHTRFFQRLIGFSFSYCSSLIALDYIHCVTANISYNYD